MVHEVERFAAGKAHVELVPHGGGSVHNPKDIYNVIKNSIKG
jgi:hypothetical protein